MSDFQRRSACLALYFAASVSLVACSSMDGANTRIASVVTPYKIDIVQGNFVSREQAAAIKPGMTRGQVRDILGTPLLVDIFHVDYFKGDLLERLDADPLPTEAEFVASLDSGRKAAAVPTLELTPEQLALLPAAAKTAETKPLPPLPASYPPLEPAKR